MTKLYINYAQITNYAARSIYAMVEPKYFAAVEAYLVDRNINQEIYDISCEDFLTAILAQHELMAQAGIKDNRCDAVLGEFTREAAAYSDKYSLTAVQRAALGNPFEIALFSDLTGITAWDKLFVHYLDWKLEREQKAAKLRYQDYDNHTGIDDARYMFPVLSPTYDVKEDITQIEVSSSSLDDCASGLISKQLL